jgi:hypothetical protein
MFKININYIIVSLGLNKETNQIEYYVVFTDPTGKLPSIELIKDQTLLDARGLICKQYLDLELHWIDDQLLDINNDKDTINIYYMCRLPIETKINNGQFFPISSQFFPDPVVQKAIRYA